ncbi:MAG: hypothetical protein A3E87_08040 [Gammaproteobacteria bacterium RIFCSPHIGHO2_12_FULL_35_23]|nr:MAG: hypothetical protein A3E87_08040 [Gammaproteobacteria bacterium RIFCSPHIGHO2_12_FULL_35_23]
MRCVLKDKKHCSVCKIIYQNLKINMWDLVNIILFFLQGFEDCYHVFLKHSKHLKSENSPLSAFKKVETRVLFKPTTEYSRLLIESFHPQLLYSAKAFRKHFDWLCETRKDNHDFDNYSNVISSETDDLLSLDILLFFHCSNEKWIRNSKGQVVYRKLALSGYEALFKQVERLSKKDLLIQKNIIKQSLFSALHSLKKEKARKIDKIKLLPVSRKLKNNQGNKKILNKVTEILDYMLLFRLKDNELSYWSYLSPAGLTDWSLNFTFLEAYNGLLDIVLVYAYAFSYTSKKVYKEIVINFVTKLDIILDTLKLKCSLEFYSGLGTFIFFIYQLNQLNFISNSSTLISKVTNHFKKTFNPEDYPLFDIIDGTAGYLAALLVTRSLIDTKVFTIQSKQCIAHLMKIYPDPRVMPENENNHRHKGRTIIGFAHGLIGVIYVMAHYVKTTNDQSVVPWIEKTLLVIQSAWNKKEKNWADAIPTEIDHSKVFNLEFSSSWCYGRIGQGICSWGYSRPI